MLKTRDRILNTARELFNKSGINGVSIRDIASEMEISDGNLRYHFKTKDEIVKALFDEVADTIGVELSGAYTNGLTIELMRTLLAHLMKNFYKYRFLLQDINIILKDYPSTRKKFMKITVERTAMVEKMIAVYVQMGYIFPETNRGEYRRMIENILILSHFWISGSRLFYSGKKSEMVNHYTENIFSMMYPYFTPKARQELGIEY